MSKKKVVIIGSGIAGLSAASYLAAADFEVTVLEKNDRPGGRARRFTEEGFTFDMGPSWYWMPDVFEKFYNDFGKTTADFYTLKRLDPSYRVFWKNNERIDIPADKNGIEELFERFEPGSAKRLHQFLHEASYKYTVGITDFVYKPSLSIIEFADTRLLSALFRIDLFTNMKKHIRNFVSHPFLIELLEFPVLFLGALPQKTPALYSLMNYADMELGTWYPMGGMYEIVNAFTHIAQAQGAFIQLNTEVKKIEPLVNHKINVHTQNNIYEADVVIGAGDYHHVEQHLLEEPNRTYTESYWNKRKMAPSALLYYLGVNKTIKNLQHHNLFFDEDFMTHAHDIYTHPKWPQRPLFYACAPSKTDPSVAPDGHENLFLLIPVAPGLPDNERVRTHYLDMLIQRLEKYTGDRIKDHIVFQRTYAHQDFIRDYHAYKGNAYGLANTLNQTAFLKPKMKSTKVKNLYFTGQLTNPGPGVPPAIISGNVVAKLIIKENRI